MCLTIPDALLLEGAARVNYAQIMAGQINVGKPGRPQRIVSRGAPALERALRNFRREKLRLLGEPTTGEKADEYANSPL